MKKVFSVIALGAVAAFAAFSTGAHATAALNVSVRIMPAGTNGQFYSYKLLGTGGVAPYAFSLNGGTLPSGLSLASDGTVSGSVGSASGTEFSVALTDAAGNTAASGAILLPIKGSGSSQVLGTASFANGSLVNDGGTVWLINKNTKVGFSTAPAFLDLGYKWNQVVTADTSTLGTARTIIDGSTSAHPSGSWISKGKTVYFVSDAGLIPVASYQIFLNNGGNPSVIVPANSTDLASGILPVMTDNDARLH